MTADEYWNQDPWLAKDYRDAWELKQKTENYNAWLYGLYSYKAVGVVVGNALRKKGARADHYFDKPLELFEEEKTPTQIRQEVYDKLKGFKEKWDARSKNQNNSRLPK